MKAETQQEYMDRLQAERDEARRLARQFYWATRFDGMRLLTRRIIELLEENRAKEAITEEHLRLIEQLKSELASAEDNIKIFAAIQQVSTKMNNICVIAWKQDKALIDKLKSDLNEAEQEQDTTIDYWKREAFEKFCWLGDKARAAAAWKRLARYYKVEHRKAHEYNASLMHYNWRLQTANAKLKRACRFYYQQYCGFLPDRKENVV